MENRKKLIKVFIEVCLFCLAIAPVTSAADQKPIVFGFVGPSSGMSAMYGEAGKNAINMAIKEINSAGGVLGRNLEAVFRDGQSDPEVTLRETKAMVYENDALWVQGCVGTSVCMPSVEFAGEAGKKENFLVLPITTGLLATEDRFNPYVFRLWANSSPVSTVMAEAVFRKYHPKKLLVVAADYSYGRESAKIFKEIYQKLDPKVEFARDIFTPLGSTDFTPYISKIMASGAEVVFNLLWGGDYGSFLKQAYAYGYYDKIHEAGSVAGQVESIGHLRKGDPWPKGVISGEYAPIWEYYGELGEGFNDRYFKEYGTYPGQMAVNNYSWVHIMASLINDVGSVDDIDKLVSGLEGRWVEHALGRFKVRAYDHQIMIPFWAGTTVWPDNLIHPRVIDNWCPPPSNYESLYHSISEIKAIREKAGNPYANYLGN